MSKHSEIHTWNDQTVRYRIAPVNLVRMAAVMTILATVSAAHAAGPAPVALGKAGFFTILSEAGIMDVSASAVTGNIGTSPITGAADHLSCSEVTGKVLSVDAAGPAPCSLAKAAQLGLAVGAMNTAYADAASRTPDVIGLGQGNIGGMTLLPGTYQWASSLMIPANVTLLGSHKDVWIFQVAQDVDVAPAAQIILMGGATSGNVFWQVAGAVTIGTSVQFKGVILGKTSIAMQTGATIAGRLYAQTAVTLQMNTVTKP